MNYYSIMEGLSSYLTKITEKAGLIFAILLVGIGTVTVKTYASDKMHHVTRNNMHEAFGVITAAIQQGITITGTVNDTNGESPLYDPRKPFENRDPRCAATIVEHGTSFGGVIWQPHPDSLICTKVPSGDRVSNKESIGVDQWAAWNGIMWRKGYDEDWYDDFLVAPEQVEIRYADVLLIYAEAKIELGDIDQSVLDVMNQVRARAYGVDYTKISDYPEITTIVQSDLRRTLRIERRMEFAFESLRYPDLLRWRLAEKALNLPNYGHLVIDDIQEAVVKPGLWFFPEVTPIDEDGIADFSSMYEKGLIRRMALRNFDASKNYLWPIPSTEIEINENMTQNPGY